ncbi:MAG: hypothetical protein KF858_15580 [Candidatus Sumerlaeia bacterium]|nr:hypothetical protein [Candidatus Sumerlaeia bacterium]
MGSLNDLWKYTPATDEWRWIKGSTIVNQSGSYGMQSVPHPTNAPGARAGASAWTDEAGNFWLFGGSGRDGTGTAGRLNDLWRFSPATTEWTWVKGTSAAHAPGTYGIRGTPAIANTPGGRVSAGLWTGDSGSLWLFGSTGHDSWGSLGWLNDLWRYNPAANEWTWMKGASTRDQMGIYGTQGVPHPENSPGGLAGPVSWTGGPSTLWLFGGFGRDNTGISGYHNALWRYNSAAGEWTWMKGTSTRDQRGTYGVQGVPHPANSPGARWTSVTWTDDSGTMWLFGGFGYGDAPIPGHLGDLWRFDAATNEWTWINGSSTVDQPATYGTQGVPHTDNTPGARTEAVCWKDASGALWLFGGGKSGGFLTTHRMNDLWRYNPATNEWTWIKGTSLANQPGIYPAQAGDYWILK